MIKIKSQNKLLLNSLNDYLENSGIALRGISNDLFTFDVECDEHNLIIKFDNKKKIFNLPVEINVITSYLSEKIKNLFVSFQGYDYYPYKRLIRNKNKKSYLTDIQNTIFYNLYFSKLGIDKQTLYGTIWSEDKNISINKLDTHLTNLKNQLLKELDFKIALQSNKKNLQLSID